MRLFKYVRAERIDILENQRIAFTQPEEFNDALDTRPRVVPMTSKAVLKRKTRDEEDEVLKQMPPAFQVLPRAERRRIGRELMKGSIKHIQENAEPIARKLQEDIYSGINALFGVLCLTTNPDHKLMWGHYADGHRGFVMEFDTKKPRFALSDDLHRIIYSNEPPTYDPAIGSQGWWKVKSKEWEYEEEYRIVSKLCECEKKIIKDKTVYLRHLPRDCVKAVFMGLKMEAAMKKRLREVCQQANINLFEAAFVNSEEAYEFRKV
jgi:Protein of unknown function (DUF2971)